MKLLADIIGSIVSILQGLRVTVTHWVARPRVTQMYPRVRREPTERYRGLFVLRRDPERPGGTRCTACGLCAQACPAGVIAIAAEGTGRERHPARYDMDLGHCLFCHLCVEACPFAALAMTTEYELACYDREGTRLDLAALTREDRPTGRTHQELAAANPREGGEQ